MDASAASTSSNQGASPMDEIQIGDRVIIDEKAVVRLIAREPKFAARIRITMTIFEVTGIGKTCYGVRAPNADKSINIPKGDVIKIVRGF